MDPRSNGNVHRGNNYGNSNQPQFGYDMQNPNFQGDSQQPMYQNMMPNNNPSQSWNPNMMGNFPMMPMYGANSGVFGPYGYIPPAGPQNFKTKKCRHFETGRCKLAGLCNFAHGDEELRTANDK